MSMRVSEPSKRRLVLLEGLLARMSGRVTSRFLSELTHWNDSLIRHDIASIGFSRGVSNGYDVHALRSAICAAFSLTERAEQRGCIVGLGRLGAALLDESMFDGSGFKIVAGFDPNVNRTEILRSTFPLYPASKLEGVVRAERIAWALLASKNEDAQALAMRLAQCGIRGIVNYTDVTLALPESVALENASPVTMVRTLFARTEG